ATHIVSTSIEQTPSQSNEVAEGSNQDDTTELDGMNSSILLWTKAHPLEQILGDPSKPIMTRSKLSNDVEMCVYDLNVRLVEPSNIKEAMAYHSCIEAMKEELHQFKRLQVWELVKRPVGRNVIGVKLIWKNKTDA
ncbi:hypothetical protein Tco_0684176, partial [Tanacetum coccineum]